MDKNLIFTIINGTVPQYFRNKWQRDLQSLLLRIIKKTNLVFDELDGLIFEGVQDLIELGKNLAKISGKTPDTRIVKRCFNLKEIKKSKEKSLIIGGVQPQKEFFRVFADLYVFCRVEPEQKKEMIEMGYGEVFQPSRENLAEVRFFIHKKYWDEEFFPEKGGISGRFLEKRILDKIVLRLWGFNELKNDQYSIIKRGLERKKVLGIMPTGAGKSVCFQLPALLSQGTSIVVAPIKSLIYDQVSNLKKSGKGFCVDFLDSSQSSPTKKRVMERWDKGFLKIIYLSPERLQQEKIREFLQKRGRNRQGFLIIDEIHCVSEWGHDFRPAYLQLVSGPQRNNKGLMGLTATAPGRVKNDLKKRFSLGKKDIIETKNLDRPEIALEVKLLSEGENRFSALQKILEERIPDFFWKEKENVVKEKAGVIFTPFARARGENTKEASTEWLKDNLEDSGFCVMFYHGALKEKEKKEVQASFLDNKIPILVSTKAFGMGIDKPDINYTIHFFAPGSLEAYFQELGRGGRNRQRTLSVLLYKPRKKKCKKNLKTNGKLEPPCSGKWSCFFHSGELCDFGVQANFIENQHLKPEKHEDNLLFLIKEITRRQGREISFFLEEDKQIFFQRYFLFLQEANLIKNYFIKSFAEKTLEFRVEKGSEKGLGKKEELISGFNLQDYKVKRRKYAALGMVEKYALEKTRCRRSILLEYMGQKVEPESRCGFCDQETLFSSEAQTIKAQNNKKAEKEKIFRLFDEEEFPVFELLEKLESLKSKGRVNELEEMAFEKLKEDPQNPGALFTRGLIDQRTGEDLKFFLSCILQLQKNGDNMGARDVLSQLILIDEENALKVFGKLKKKTYLASCGYLFLNPKRRKKFALFCMQSWAEEIAKSLGGNNRG